MKLLLVDGSALLHRAYHAYPSLTTRKGQVVGAVYGVVSMLISALTEEEPTRVVVAWDLPKPTFRHSLYVAYKAHRVKADEEMVEQIPLVKELIGTMGLTQIEEVGYEADDIIGTLAQKQEGEVVILTGDQDTMQLVTPTVKVLTPSRGRIPAQLYGPEQVKEKYGVNPAQIVDYKALTGDASDNIPGVRGIGPKGAAQLLTEYKTLDGIYAHLEEIPERVREKLTENKESAYLSRELATIVTKMKIEIKEGELEYTSFATPELKIKLEELNFRSLVRRVYGEAPKLQVDERQMGMF